MKPLFGCYSTIQRSYYREITIRPTTLFLGNDAKDQCRRFIEEHFEKGKKRGVFEIPDMFINEYIRDGKHFHTVSLYLLGLFLGNCFEPFLRQKMCVLFNDSTWWKFKYCWYLTCLCHDVASCIEKDQTYMKLLDSVENSSLFAHIPMKSGADLSRFSKELIMNYLEYRKEKGRVEHSIVGGALLFDKLTQSFVRKTRKHDWNSNPIFKEGPLVWRREHLDHFAYIADAVCYHNIWMVSIDDKEKCREYTDAGLQALIIRNPSDRLNIWNYPLQFMLCLLDTIEPIKRFEKLGVETVLKNIYVEKEDDGIRIAWSSKIKSDPKFCEWITGITTLSTWMAVDVTPCQHDGERCGLKITITK